MDRVSMVVPSKISIIGSMTYRDPSCSDFLIETPNGCRREGVRGHLLEDAVALLLHDPQTFVQIGEHHAAFPDRTAASSLSLSIVDHPAAFVGMRSDHSDTTMVVGAAMPL